MTTPHMPHIPGAAVMTDTLDFVKNLWGSMGVPGIAAPTLSVDELDKKISDLKAVEAWLQLNTNMLRGSIQALEVQRNTIATLKSMGKTMAAAMQQPAEAQEKGTSLFDTIPYASAFFQHATDAMQQQAAPAPAAPPPQQAAAPAAEPDPAVVAAAAQMINPAAWWGLLQDQFKQAVATTMSPEAVSAAAARATEAAGKFAAGAANPLAKDKTGIKTALDEAAQTGAREPAARKAPAKRAAAKKG